MIAGSGTPNALVARCCRSAVKPSKTHKNKVERTRTNRLFHLVAATQWLRANPTQSNRIKPLKTKNHQKMAVFQVEPTRTEREKLWLNDRDTPGGSEQIQPNQTKSNL
jgi:hypothetical protein